MESFMMLTLSQQLKGRKVDKDSWAPQKLAFHLGDPEHPKKWRGTEPPMSSKTKPRAACPLAQGLVGRSRIKQEFNARCMGRHSRNIC